MNKNYLQHIFVKEILKIIDSSGDIELISSYKKQEYPETFSKKEAILTLFEEGLNINSWFLDESLFEPKQKPLIDKILNYCDDIELLNIFIEKVDSHFFDSIGYQNQCNIVEKILEKRLPDAQKTQLIDQLFDKGFKIVQKSSHDSVELDWINYGHQAFFDSLLNKQADFKWTYLYSDSYEKKTYTVIEKMEEVLLDSLDKIDSQSKRELQLKIISMKEKFDKVYQHEEFNNKMPSKPGHKMTKI